jgi:hypothetical protein
MSSMFSELPVQPYDNMGSILIEYAMRVQFVCKTFTGSRIKVGTDLAGMVDLSF